jgi:predicted branched-subunit amino acid permease
MTSRTRSPVPYWSADGLKLGARYVAPLLPATIAFGVAVGSAAATKGLTFLEQLLLVFAGMSQMVALEVWPAQMTPAAIAGLALVAATVNARMMLLSAGLRPWLAPLPAWQVYPTLHLVTDVGWLIAMRYRADGGADAGIILGGGLFFYFFWAVATSAGYLAGTFVPDPRAIALDLVMPIFFAAMLVPLWRGARRAIAWAIAGIVALFFHYFVDGWWYVIAGSLAGVLAAGFIDDE